MPAIDVTTLETLVEAACRYGTVLDLLSVIHDMRKGQTLESTEADLLDTASIAALLAKVERINQGIDLK
jgi:hypothetical protein